MSEIFLKDDISSLLENRFIVIIGDSIQRAVYKDIVLLLQKNQYLTDSQLRRKGEITFSGDELVEGGTLGEISNGVGYREVRQYQTDYHLVRFYFVTRCYNAYVESLLTDLSQDPLPDVICMNSCLWDISRYGKSSVDQYKKNMERLFVRFQEVLPPTCLIIWNSTLPISKRARGGFLIPGVEFMNSVLRLDILEANFYVHKLAVEHGFDVLDLHYYLRHQLQRRAGDGVHWDMTAHRRITNLIMTHIAEAWGIKTTQHARQHLLQTFNKNILADAQYDAQCNAGLLPDPVPRQAVSLGMFANAFSNPAHFNNNHNMNMQLQQDMGPGSPYQTGSSQDYCQTQFINKYGGPIKRVAFGENNSPLASLETENSQFRWEPYENRNYNANLGGGMYCDRMGRSLRPFSGKSFHANFGGGLYSDRMRPYKGRIGRRSHNH